MLLFWRGQMVANDGLRQVVSNSISDILLPSIVIPSLVSCSSPERK